MRLACDVGEELASVVILVWFEGLMGGLGKLWVIRGTKWWRIRTLFACTEAGFYGMGDEYNIPGLRLLQNLLLRLLLLLDLR